MDSYNRYADEDFHTLVARACIYFMREFYLKLLISSKEIHKFIFSMKK